MAGELRDVFHVVREAGNQHVPEPDGFAEGGQAFRELQGRAQFPACQGLVLFRVPCLDVQQDHVRVRQHVFIRIPSQVAGGVQAGVQAQAFASLQHGFGKVRLKKGIASG